MLIEGIATESSHGSVRTFILKSYWAVEVVTWGTPGWCNHSTGIMVLIFTHWNVGRVARTSFFGVVFPIKYEALHITSSATFAASKRMWGQQESARAKDEVGWHTIIYCPNDKWASECVDTWINQRGGWDREAEHGCTKSTTAVSGGPANLWFTPDALVDDLLVHGCWNRGCVMISPGVSPCLPPSPSSSEGRQKSNRHHLKAKYRAKYFHGEHSNTGEHEFNTHRKNCPITARVS